MSETKELIESVVYMANLIHKGARESTHTDPETIGGALFEITEALTLMDKRITKLEQEVT